MQSTTLTPMKKPTPISWTGIILSLIFLYLFSIPNEVKAQTSGDIRTVTSGAWDHVAIWETFDVA